MGYKFQIKLLDNIMKIDKTFSEFSDKELNIIANLKRVEELFFGIKEFRDAVLDNPEEIPSLVAGFGLTIDTKEFIPIFESAKKTADKKLKKTPIKYSSIQKLWIRYKQSRNNTSWFKDILQKSSGNKQFDAWRKRQIKRSCSETGTPKEMNFFPVFAYELAQGCSVNCSFCCFSAQKLQEVFLYNKENSKLWKDILQVGVELFKDMSKLSMGYHTTEPFDNPDYYLFMEDFHKINGILPQTTSAAPLKNLELTRKILDMRKKNPINIDRFSILTTSQYKKLFNEFTPMELNHVELVYHNEGGLANKAYSGRALEKTEKIKKSNQKVREYYKVENTIEQTSVECTCGFLVNMVEKSIKLIAPCIADKENPKGYKTINKGTFENAQEYKAWIQTTIEEFMPLSLEWNDIIGFRKDLKYQQIKEGFELTSCNNRYSLKSKPWHKHLGKMIFQGNFSQGNISLELSSKGAILPEVLSSLQKLFDAGLIETQD